MNESEKGARRLPEADVGTGAHHGETTDPPCSSALSAPDEDGDRDSVGGAVRGSHETRESGAQGVGDVSPPVKGQVFGANPRSRAS